MRAMYLRRLRSIMDEFLNGWVQQQFTNNYNIIAAAATKDNAKWNGGPPALGYKCVIDPSDQLAHTEYPQHVKCSSPLTAEGC